MYVINRKIARIEAYLRSLWPVSSIVFASSVGVCRGLHDANNLVTLL